MEFWILQIENNNYKYILLNRKSIMYWILKSFISNKKHFPARVLFVISFKKRIDYRMKDYPYIDCVCFWFVNKIIRALHFYHVYCRFLRIILLSFTILYISIILNPRKLGGKLEKPIELFHSLLSSIWMYKNRVRVDYGEVNRMGMPKV